MRQVVTRGAKNTALDYKAALNCVRLVTRLLPFIEEDQSDEFLEAVFWRGELPAARTAPAKPTEGSEGAPADATADAQTGAGIHHRAA